MHPDAVYCGIGQSKVEEEAGSRPPLMSLCFNSIIETSDENCEENFSENCDENCDEPLVEINQRKLGGIVRQLVVLGELQLQKRYFTYLQNNGVDGN